MNYAIQITDNFFKKIKKLVKKYKSLADDLEILKKELIENPEIGVSLGGNVRKIRMAIASKGKGKSGGARVITCDVIVDIENTDIYLLTIYDKNEQENISEKEIQQLKEKNGLK